MSSHDSMDADPAQGLRGPNRRSVPGPKAMAAWKAIVAEYAKPHAGRATWQIINTVGGYVALWVGMELTLGISWWLTVPLAVLAGGMFLRVFIIFHDCGHGSFYASRRANDFWGFVTGLLTFTPYYHWRGEHAIHHGTTGDLDRRGIGDIWTMTVQEYLESSRWRRFSYRLARNPIVLFVVAPLVLFLFIQRIPKPSAKPHERRSVWWMNLASLVMVVVMSLIFGFVPYLVIQLTVLMVAGSVGVWLFYLQHQFEDAYWERGPAWDPALAAMQGSSFFKLPRILQWFSGNIGFHHIHHLSSRIPNYNLQRCHESDPVFQDVEPMTLIGGLRALGRALWDESSKKLVGFRHLRPLAIAAVRERSRGARLVLSGLRLAAGFALLVMGAWCFGAVFYSNLPGQALRTGAASLFALPWLWALVAWARRRRQAVPWMLGAFVVVLAWWWFIPASNDRDWAPEMARMPHVDVEGDRVTVYDVRNCDFRTETDFDVRWEDKVLDLRDLRTVDYIWSSWGVKGVVHTMISFGFGGGEHMVLSVMPRREKDELHTTAIGSLFKQYELLYMLADECDVLRVRSNVRHEDLYVVPTTTTPDQARELFMAVVDRVNDLYQHPRWYNLVTDNCTSGLIPMIETIHPAEPRWTWRYLLNADTMRMTYDNGRLASPLSFEQTFERCHVNPYVADHPECAGYSERIRPDLQAPPAPR